MSERHFIILVVRCPLFSSCPPGRAHEAAWVESHVSPWAQLVSTSSSSDTYNPVYLIRNLLKDEWAFDFGLFIS